MMILATFVKRVPISIGEGAKDVGGTPEGVETRWITPESNFHRPRPPLPELKPLRRAWDGKVTSGLSDAVGQSGGKGAVSKAGFT